MDDVLPSNRRNFSPTRKMRNITPIRHLETPNPQTPYKNTPNYIQPNFNINLNLRPNTAVSNSPQRSSRIKPINKKLSPKNKNIPTANSNASPTSSFLNVRSSRLFAALNEKTHRFECVLENFLHEAASVPVSIATEKILLEELSASTVVYWQDIPSLQLLYSQKLNHAIGHTKGIIGQTFFSRQKLTVDESASHPNFDAEIDALAGTSNIPQMFFPLWDYSNTVCAVVQVFKSEGFDEDDEEFVAYFIKKFKVYSHWIDHFETPHSLILELMQNMEMEQFLLLFQKKVTGLFQCDIAEIWKYDKKLKQMYQYRKVAHEITDLNAGIVGESFKKSILINCESSKMRSSYHLPVDGEKDQPVLVYPVLDSQNNTVYALAVRGKNNCPIFTLQDEFLIKSIAPYIILSLNNIEKYTNREKNNRLNQSQIRCVSDLQDIITLLEKNEEDKKILCTAMEKLEELSSADRCSLFLYDKPSKKLKTLFYNGLKVPLSVPVDKGVVGATFRESQIYNIPDAYEDNSFDSTTDLESGYRTKSLLSVPIKSDMSNTLGVVQLMNKLDGKPFSKHDVGYARIFATICALILSNKKKDANLKAKKSQVKAYMRCSEIITNRTDTIRATLNEILSTAKTIMKCENYSLFIVDHVLGSLTTYIVDGPKLAPTFPLGNGIAAATVTNESHPILIVNDAYHDPRFNSTADMTNGFKTRSVLAVPVFSSERTVIAVIEMINKTDTDFTSEDGDVMKMFSGLIGQVIEMQKLNNIIKHGTAELEMQKWIGEVERKSFITPKKLEIPQSKVNEVASLNFFCIEWNGIGLFKVAFFVFNQFNLLERYQITNDLFFVFLVKLRTTYNDVPYHNWIHAIDVLQYVGYQIRKANFINILTSHELLALCVSAICHDSNHEGLNNAYLQKAETPLGILYKDLSVCEMHHCAMTISLLSKDDCNIFHAIPPNDLKYIWHRIIQLILATDMAHHFKLLKTANDIMDQGPVNLSNQSHRLMAMTMIIKCADISNVSRPFEIADKWCDVLCQEFWRQGDMEIANGWEISSPLNDRSITEKAKGQVNFYTFVCIPFYTSISRFLPELMCNAEAVNENLQIWKDKVEQLEKLKQAKEEQLQGAPPAG